MSRWPATGASTASIGLSLDAGHAVTLRQMRAEQAVTSAFEAAVEKRDLADYEKVLEV